MYFRFANSFAFTFFGKCDLQWSWLCHVSNSIPSFYSLAFIVCFGCEYVLNRLHLWCAILAFYRGVICLNKHSDCPKRNYFGVLYVILLMPENLITIMQISNCISIMVFLDLQTSILQMLPTFCGWLKCLFTQVKMAIQYMRRVIQKRAKFDIMDLNTVQVWFCYAFSTI